MGMQETKKRKFGPIVILTLTSLIVGTVGGVFLHKYAFLSKTERQMIDEYRLLKDDWLYGNEEEYLNGKVLSGILKEPAEASDDPYTFYTSDLSKQNLSVSNSGFGFSSRYYDGYLMVNEIHDGDGLVPSASKNKLMKKDIIKKARRASATEYFDFKTHTRNEIDAYLSDKNHVKEDYTFLLERDGSEMEVVMKASAFQQNTTQIIQYPKEENGYTMLIQIDTFLGNPYLSVKTAIESQLKNTEIRKLVFDLRGNGGGYVEQAYELASLFVEKGTLVYELRDKNGQVTTAKTQTENPKFSIKDYGIIIDSNSASASEIFTLSMRAGTSCIVYGNKSYGKGIAQNLKTYSDGSVVRYTANYVYGPKRKNDTLVQNPSLPYSYNDVICIQGSGIVPDVGYTCDIDDYTLLYPAYDYTLSYGLKESAMDFFLKALAYIYPSAGFPDSFSGDYVFSDSVRQYAKLLTLKYHEEYQAFDQKGRLSKAVNDKFNKDTYDRYLKDHDAVTSSALGE